MFIIFGTQAVTKYLTRGLFNCPSCQSEQNYENVRVQQFFTLFFIPLIPMNVIGEYIECECCRNAFKPETRYYDPKEQQEKFEAEYFRAVKEVMIHMLLADGEIEDQEVKSAGNIYHQLTGKDISEDVFRKEITRIQDSAVTLTNTLQNLQGTLNDSGKEMVVKAALHVAFSDGEFQKEEQQKLVEIGTDLGMSQSQIQGVINRL